MTIENKTDTCIVFGSIDIKVAEQRSVALIECYGVEIKRDGGVYRIVTANDT